MDYGPGSVSLFCENSLFAEKKLALRAFGGISQHAIKT